MNERIRLLAELADKAIRETDLREVNGGIHITPAFEKFAELIVQDLMDSMIKRYGDDDELPIQEIKLFVKEHFGVEE